MRCIDLALADAPAKMRPSSSPVPSDPATQRELRWRAIRSGASFGIAARVVSVACTLAQVPIAISHLGLEGFGLWMTLSSVAGVLTISDLGLSLSARTLLADLFGRNDSAGLRSVSEECHRRLRRAGIVVALVGSVLAVAIDWAAVFKVTSAELGAQLPWALVGLAVAAGAAVPASLGPSLAAAVQLPWMQHAAAAAASALTLGAVAVAAALNVAWTLVVVFTLALPALINGAIYLLVRRRLGWRGRTLSTVTTQQSVTLHRLGGWFMLPQAGSLFMVMAIPIAIAATASPIAVTAFNMLQRVFGTVNQAHWMALSALWPAYSEARARGDFVWMRQAYRSSWTATLLLFVPSVLVLAQLMPALVSLWVGNDVPPIDPLLIWVSAAWFAVQLVGHPPSLVLNGLGRLRVTALYGTAGHVLSLLGMYVGGRIAGAPGVVAGMALGYVLVGLPAMLLDTKRAMRELTT